MQQHNNKSSIPPRAVATDLVSDTDKCPLRGNIGPLRTTGLEWQPRRTERFFEGKTMTYLPSVLQDPFSIKVGPKRLHNPSSTGKQKTRSQILQWSFPSILFFKMFFTQSPWSHGFTVASFYLFPPEKAITPYLGTASLFMLSTNISWAPVVFQLSFY